MSIFHRKHKFNTALLLVDALALVLLLGIAFLVLLAVTNEKESSSLVSDETEQALEALTRNYLHEVDALLLQIQEEKSMDADTLSVVQETLLGMRVPAHMQDAHLTAVLTLGRLSSQSQEGTPETVSALLAELARRY